MTVAAAGRPRAAWRTPLARLGLAVAAVALVAGVIALGFWLFTPAAPPRPPRNPFGAAAEAAPAATGWGATLLAIQASYYRHLQAAVLALKESGAVWPLTLIGFAYGAFHAAGPGHGKAVIAAYLVASDRALAKAIGLSFAAALVQALVAVSVVALLALTLKATAGTMTGVTRAVEIASFAALALVGAVITWRKAGALLGVAALAGGAPEAAPPASCDHAHLPAPDEIERRSLRETLGIVLAAGIRPCSGALVILVFTVAQGLFWAGVAATFAMALGTALTTSAIAALAVLAKGLALRLAGGRGASGTLAVAGLELLAAAFVLALGLVLLAGLFAGGAPS